MFNPTKAWVRGALREPGLTTTAPKPLLASPVASARADAIAEESDGVMVPSGRWGPRRTGVCFAFRPIRQRGWTQR